MTAINNLADAVGNAVGGTTGTVVANVGHVLAGLASNLPADAVATATATVHSTGLNGLIGQVTNALGGHSGNTTQTTAPITASVTGLDVSFTLARNEIITSGGGNDTFVANPGFGQDTITDFNPSQDVIQFNPALFANYAAVLGATTQVGSDSVIAYDANDKVTLTNVSVPSLTASNFHFS